MSLHHTTFYSNELKMNTSAYVILPESKDNNEVPIEPVDKRYPVLWLLHGLFDDESMFLRYTSIERYASDTGIAVVMPRAERSFYTDMALGGRYWHFISEELPQRMRFFYPLSLDPAENFVAGASIGGYGAYKWAFTHPDRFAGVAALSGVMDITNFETEHADLIPDWHLIFDDQPVKDTPADLVWLVDHMRTDHLQVFQTVGTEDFLYQPNIKMKAILSQAFGDHYTYSECHGSHDFNFWDQQLPIIMHWFQRLLKK